MKESRSFNWYKMKQRFSIRKYHFGVASVLLGMFMVLGGMPSFVSNVGVVYAVNSPYAQNPPVADSTNNKMDSATGYFKVNNDRNLHVDNNEQYVRIQKISTDDPNKVKLEVTYLSGESARFGTRPFAWFTVPEGMNVLSIEKKEELTGGQYGSVWKKTKQEWRSATRYLGTREANNYEHEFDTRVRRNGSSDPEANYIHQIVNGQDSSGRNLSKEIYLSWEPAGGKSFQFVVEMQRTEEVDADLPIVAGISGSGLSRYMYAAGFTSFVKEKDIVDDYVLKTISKTTEKRTKSDKEYGFIGNSEDLGDTFVYAYNLLDPTSINTNDLLDKLKADAKTGGTRPLVGIEKKEAEANRNNTSGLSVYDNSGSYTLNNNTIKVLDVVSPTSKFGGQDISNPIYDSIKNEAKSNVLDITEAENNGHGAKQFTLFSAQSYDKVVPSTKQKWQVYAKNKSISVYSDLNTETTHNVVNLFTVGVLPSQAKQYTPVSKAGVTVEKNDAVPEPTALIDDAEFIKTWEKSGRFTKEQATSIAWEGVTPSINTVGEQTGKVRITYPDGSYDIQDVKFTVTEPPVTPDNAKHEPTVSPDPVSKAEGEKATEDEVKAKVTPSGGGQITSVSIPEDTTAGQREATVTVEYPDGTQDSVKVPLEYVATSIGTVADKTDIVKPDESVKVVDPTNLTEAEKDAVKKAVEDKNLEIAKKGGVVKVSQDGSVTVVYPDGSTDTLPATDVISKKTTSKILPYTGEESAIFATTLGVGAFIVGALLVGRRCKED